MPVLAGTIQRYDTVRRKLEGANVYLTATLNKCMLRLDLKFPRDNNFLSPLVEYR